MFRAQQNIFDDTIGKYPRPSSTVRTDGEIAKATDEYLISENWELILVHSLLKPSPSAADLQNRRMSATKWAQRTQGTFLRPLHQYPPS